MEEGGEEGECGCLMVLLLWDRENGMQESLRNWSLGHARSWNDLNVHYLRAVHKIFSITPRL